MRQGAFEGRSAHPERIDSFFDFAGPDGKEKAQRPVRRFELMAMLGQYHRAQQSRAFRRRLWRWLTTRQNWAATAIPAPTKRQVERAAAEAPVGQPNERR